LLCNTATAKKAKTCFLVKFYNSFAIGSMEIIYFTNQDLVFKAGKQVAPNGFVNICLQSTKQHFVPVYLIRL